MVWGGESGWESFFLLAKRLFLDTFDDLGLRDLVMHKTDEVLALRRLTS